MESFFYTQGFSQSRVRNYGDFARIEVNENEIEKIGFAYITFDLDGYRSGSMNEVL